MDIADLVHARRGSMTKSTSGDSGVANTGGAAGSALRKIVASPLVHFFLIGGLVFAVYGAMNDDPTESAPDTIVLSAGKAELLAKNFAATWRRPPTTAEMQGLMDAWVREEALVREAQLLGLDRDDTAIRMRLAQKLQFLIEGQVAGLQPDDATLDAFLQANPDTFRLPVRIAFEQIKLPENTRDQISTIREALDKGQDPASVGVATLLPASMALTDAETIDLSFGSGFSAELATLPIGSWQGPVKTGFGDLLVRVTDKRQGRLPTLDQIRHQVEAEWRAAETAKLRETYADGVLSRYAVEMPDAAAVIGK